MNYYFNELDPNKFQRLINAILVARFGEDIRITPMYGKDGGKDGETAPGNPYFEFEVGENDRPPNLMNPPRKGRYLFQVKYHQTTDRRISDVRQSVINEFKEEWTRNVLPRKGNKRPNYFILVTNVPSSGDAFDKIDVMRNSIMGPQNILTDVWWEESITAYLDQIPSIWQAFPEMFAGRMIPILGSVVGGNAGGLPRTLRMAIDCQYEQDKKVKFRQIQLEQNLSKLFVDLDIEFFPEAQREALINRSHASAFPDRFIQRESRFREYREGLSALSTLLDSSNRRMLFEGGPGQGKSTITQMAAQIYRQQILGKSDLDPENRWTLPEKIYLPFRVEFRMLADWLTSNKEGSIEQYLAMVIARDSGGAEIKVEDIHTVFEKSPVILIFDGLDEVGNDDLRDVVLKKITEAITRFEDNLKTDLRVVITSRPPAIAGRRKSLPLFEQFMIAPMVQDRIEEYVARWLSVQIQEDSERVRILTSFNRRKYEPHVHALARNPMQLSVLLQFIQLKGEAFPDRRADLYHDYFQIVIDRDVEKSAELRENRDIIESLHGFLGYIIHALTEMSEADRSLERNRLISMVEQWLTLRGGKATMAQQFFKLGEERFGLIIASKGEGQETRYGFEVQPIQEYFAGAFISNQISENLTHEYFEEMIRRPYWNEVALFLAGLQRQNEKADLIVRARKLDLDPKLGWRQDGRSMVLQLLKEGVFSEPGYVFSEALDYVLDLLDSKLLSIQCEPDDLLPSLGKLVSQSRLERHQIRILKMLKENNSCDDSYVMRRLYRIASHLLTISDLYKTNMDYRGNNPALVAEVRLGWPYRLVDETGVGLYIEQITSDRMFWEGVSDSTWAEIWWKESCRSGVVLNLNVPLGVHGHLLEQFAFGPQINSMAQHDSYRFVTPKSKLAIWKLVRYQQMISVIGLLKYGFESEFSNGKLIRDQFALVIGEELDLEYDGLGECTDIVKDIIQCSYQLIIAFAKNNNEDKEPVINYLNAINKYLQRPGLKGWIACRCARNIIEGLIMRDPRILASLEESIKTELFSLADRLKAFYENTNSGPTGLKQPAMSTNKFINELSHQHFMFRPVYREFESERYTNDYFGIHSIPKYILIESNNEICSILEILEKHIKLGNDVPFQWMNTMKFPDWVIRPLVDRCVDCMPNLLRWLGENQFVFDSGADKLRVQDTNRILKIARQHDDPQILRGAAVALSAATFQRFAEPDVILKILQSNPQVRFSDMLFPKEVHVTTSDGRALSGQEIELSKSLATSILNSAKRYPFQIVCKAAKFATNNFQLNLMPLQNIPSLQDPINQEVIKAVNT